MWPVLAPALPVLVVAAVLSGIGREADVTLLVEDERLQVKLGRWDRFYCFKSGVTIPLPDIAGVSVARRVLLSPSGLRMPGTAVPGVILAGSFGAGADREFWNVRRAPEALVVELRPGAPYRRLVLEVADPAAEAQRIHALIEA